jgi:acyl-CoA synthetase (NDP forming)
MTATVTTNSRKLYRHADLHRVFSPKSVAIIGASPNTASFGTRTIERLQRDYTGRLFPINAKYGEVAGLTCYPSVAELPEPADCVVIALPLEAVEASVMECVGKGVGGVMIYASGYAETGRADRVALQQRLTDIAREHDIRIVGPNCMGYVNFAIRAGVTFTRGEIKIDSFHASGLNGGIGLVSQSGAMGFSQAQGAHRGIPMSHVIASGNSCDIDVADTAAYLAEDPTCKAVVCIFEGMSDPQRLIEAGHIAWANDKPMIVCKQGIGEAGAKAALSHSGSLAGSLDAYQAAFERAGIIMLNDLDGLLETASFFVKAPRRPAGRGVAAVGISGGALVATADKADEYGIAMPQPHAAVQQRLQARIPEFGAARNPCDVTAMASRDTAMIPDCADYLASDEHFCTVMYPQTSVVPQTVDELRQFSEACAKHGKPSTVVWLTGWLGGYGMKEAEADPNMAVFYSLNRFFWTLREWFRRDDRRRHQELHGPRKVVRLSAPEAKDKAAKLIAAATNKTLTEREAKAVLACYGVPVVGEQLVQSAAKAAAAAQALGFPVAMKVESPDIPHKTEAGVIRLNLTTAEDVKAAHDAVMANAYKYNAKARINGVLVQPMVPSGTEIMVGAKIDPLFGPMIITGLGGILVELLKDTAVELAPVTQHEAKAMLGRLKGQAMLSGFRGAEPVNQDKLAAVIVRLAEFIADQQGLVAELDVNPLICSGDRIVAVDALIVKK